MAVIMKGMDVANAKKDSMLERTNALKEKGITPCLGIIRAGDKPEDISYERGALKRLESVGVAGKVKVLDKITREELISTLRSMNEDRNIHGILVFQPLPEGLSVTPLKKLIDPAKDVDSMGYENAGKILTGDESGYAPCTAEGVLWMLDFYNIDLTGKKIVIIGRSNVVGKPLAMMLLKRNATVTICHTKTKNLARECQNADVLIVAAGKAGMIGADMVKPNQVVVDVGINVDENGKLCGDVLYEEVEKIVSYISPVPGGTGSITSSVLAEHVIRAAENLRES